MFLISFPLRSGCKICQLNLVIIFSTTTRCLYCISSCTFSLLYCLWNSLFYRVSFDLTMISMIKNGHIEICIFRSSSTVFIIVAALLLMSDLCFGCCLCRVQDWCRVDLSLCTALRYTYHPLLELFVWCGMDDASNISNWRSLVLYTHFKNGAHYHRAVFLIHVRSSTRIQCPECH